MPSPILIPQVYPPDLGNGDKNGDRGRYQPILAMENAVPHLAFTRRGFISGWTGRRIVTTGDDRFWRFRFRREQYTGFMTCVVWYSTTSALISATLRAGTPEDSTAGLPLPPTVGPSAEEAVTARIRLQGGQNQAGDAGIEDAFTRILGVSSADPTEKGPGVIVWSVKWYVEPLAYVELP